MKSFKELINELGISTLKSYTSKAGGNATGHGDAHFNKRMTGIRKANDHISIKHAAIKASRPPKKRKGVARR